MAKIIEGVHKADLNNSQIVMVVTYLSEQPVDDQFDITWQIE